MKNLVCVTIIEDWWSCHLFSVLCRSVGDFEWKNRTNGGTHCIEFGLFFFGKILNSELVLVLWHVKFLPVLPTILWHEV